MRLESNGAPIMELRRYLYPGGLKELSRGLSDYPGLQRKILNAETSLIETAVSFSTVVENCKDISETNLRKMALDKPLTLKSSLMKSELGSCKTDVVQLDKSVFDLQTEIHQTITRCSVKIKECSEECDNKTKLIQKKKLKVSWKKEDIESKEERTNEKEREKSRLSKERSRLRDQQEDELKSNIGKTAILGGVALGLSPFTGGGSLVVAAVAGAKAVDTVIDYKAIDEKIDNVDSTIGKLRRQIRSLEAEVEKLKEDIRSLKSDVKSHEKMKEKLSRDRKCLKRVDKVFRSSIRMSQRAEEVIQDILMEMRDADMQIDAFEMIRTKASGETTREATEDSRKQRRRVGIKRILERNHEKLKVQMQKLADICDNQTTN